MKNDRLVQKPEVKGAFRTRLLMVCFLFALGAVLGVLAHGIVTTKDDELLQAYILQFTQASAGAEDRVASMFSVLLVYFRYPLLVTLCGFVAAGLVLVPLTCLAQGFFLAFSVGCFASALGRDGIVLALAAFGVRCILMLPCTFYLAVQAMARSYSKLQAGKMRAAFEVWPYFKCLWILIFGIVAELTVVPKLLQLALAGIS